MKKNGILFPEGLFYEDNVFFVKAVLCAECIICIPNRLYMRRLRPDSTMTGELTEKKGLDYINTAVAVGTNKSIFRKRKI